ncbi:hypothetical protein FF1_001976 [Malus domestica]
MKLDGIRGFSLNGSPFNQSMSSTWYPSHDVYDPHPTVQLGCQCHNLVDMFERTESKKQDKILPWKILNS